jgi:hypothetical protein
MYLWNVSQSVPDYTVQHPRRQPSSYCRENLKSNRVTLYLNIIQSNTASFAHLPFGILSIFHKQRQAYSIMSFVPTPLPQQLFMKLSMNIITREAKFLPPIILIWQLWRTLLYINYYKHGKLWKSEVILINLMLWESVLVEVMHTIGSLNCIIVAFASLSTEAFEGK